jgi:MFS family permease
MRLLVKPLTVGVLGQAMASFTALTPPVFAVVAAPDFGLEPRAVGGFTVSLFLGAMFSAAAGGGLVARLGAVGMTQICLLFCALGIALVASGNLALAALGGLIVGIGYGPMTPASSYMLAPVTDDRNRPFVFSLKQTSVPIGGVLAGLAIPAFVAIGGWQGAALAVALLNLALAVALLPMRGALDRAGVGPRPPRTGLRAAAEVLRRNRRLRQLGIMSFAYSAVQLCLGAYLVSYLYEDIHLSFAAAGFVLSLAQGMGIVGRLAWGYAGARLVSARTVLAGLGIVTAVASLATAAMADSWPIVAIAAVAAIYGGTAIAWNGLFLAEIVRVTPRDQSASATGAALFLTFGGMVVGPATFGILAGVLGYSAAFAAIAVVTLVPGLWLLGPEPAASGAEPAE